MPIHHHPYCQAIHRNPGTISCVSSCRFCLISNLALPYLEELKLLPRNRFEAEIHSFQVGYLKPAVEMYEAAAACVGCDPKDMIMVGDRLDNDVVGALDAGFRRAFWVKREGGGDSGNRWRRSLLGSLTTAWSSCRGSFGSVVLRPETA